MNFATLQKTIGITFKNERQLKQAFVHRSYLNEDREFGHSNERLEFLGDAILSFLTSEYLFQNYPHYPEGTLTNLRSSLVKTQSLAAIAKNLHLGELLFLSRGEEESGGRTNPSLLADTFEALLGAIFLDQGLPAAKKFLLAHLFSKTEGIIAQKAYIDFKSFLQEIVQEEKRISPIYRVKKPKARITRKLSGLKPSSVAKF